MSVATTAQAKSEALTEKAGTVAADVKQGVDSGPDLTFENAREFGEAVLEENMTEKEMNQMGAKRIGSLAIGIGVVGIVLNQMSNMDVVTNSTGVVDVLSIFETAGSGLQLLVVGVIIAAAAVLLNLWSGF